MPTIDATSLMTAMPPFAIDAAVKTLTKTSVRSRKFLEPWTPPSEAFQTVRYDYRHGLRVSATVPVKTHLRIYDMENPLYCPLDTIIPPGESISYETPEKYFIKWALEINGQVQPFTLADKDVLIRMRADTLGDALYWLTALERFQAEHHCRVSAAVPEQIIPLFSRSRPDINWITHQAALETYPRYTAVYRLGVYGDPNNPYEIAPYRCNNLINHAEMILGQPLDHTPPPLDLAGPRQHPNHYVAICASASGKKKTWPLENYSRLTELLTQAGWDVVAVGGGPCPAGAIDRTGHNPLQETVNILKDADFYIGGPSGVYALAWATNTPRVMISGFTTPPVEAHTPYRVYPRTGCRFCWSVYLELPLAVTPTDCPAYDQSRISAHLGKPITREAPVKPCECLDNMTVDMALSEVKRLIADHGLTPGRVQ